MPKEIAIQIQGKERTVSELLKAKKYSIDYYQREYRWETKHISELIEDLASGELCLVLSFSGDVQQAQARAQERAEAAKTKAPEIRYVIPREGAMRWTDVVAIPKNAKHIENAHRFLQYLMEPKVIAGISNFVAYANANTSATALLDDKVAEDPGIYPPADVRAKLSTARTPTEAEAKERKLVWNNIIYRLM